MKKEGTLPTTAPDEPQLVFQNISVIYNYNFSIMSKTVKSKIYKMLEEIEDETVLNQVMEDVAFYTTKKDIVDKLSPSQLKELDKAIKEADNKETVSWDDFKKEMNEWRKK